jgi:hypothetical protein
MDQTNGLRIVIHSRIHSTHCIIRFAARLAVMISYVYVSSDRLYEEQDFASWSTIFSPGWLELPPKRPSIEKYKLIAALYGWLLLTSVSQAEW